MDKINKIITPNHKNIIKNVIIVITIMCILCCLFYYLTNYLELNGYNNTFNKNLEKKWNIIEDIKYIRQKQKQNFENF